MFPGHGPYFSHERKKAGAGSVSYFAASAADHEYDLLFPVINLSPILTA